MTRPTSRRERKTRGNEERHNSFSSFLCIHCGQAVPATVPGSEHRNHCPHCLWSRHLDVRPGDRRSGCKGPMEPIALWIRKSGEWSLVHRCKRCNILRTNRTGGDDNAMLLLSLALKPLAQPPFPLERLPELGILHRGLMNRKVDK